MKPTLAALLLCLLAAPALADYPDKPTRSAAAVRAFKRLHPCPETGAPRGACPGWVVDHIEPLCAGGPDHPRNMQWQTVADAKAKDRHERRQCRAMKRGG